jgi:hypothetical protein
VEPAHPPARLYCLHAEGDHTGFTTISMCRESSRTYANDVFFFEPDTTRPFTYTAYCDWARGHEHDKVTNFASAVVSAFDAGEQR